MCVSKSLRFWFVLMLLSLPVGSLHAAPPTDSLTSEQEEQLTEAKKLSSRVDELIRQGKTRDAVPLATQGLDICTTVLGEEHIITVRSRNNLCLLLKAQGDYAAARPYYEQAVKISKKVFGEEHPETAAALNDLGGILKAQEDYADARQYLEQALKIRKKVLGEEHLFTATSLNDLGVLLQAQGDYAGARLNLERALKIRRKVLGERPATAVTLNYLGILLQSQGDYAAARTYYEQALKIRRKVLGDEHPDTATSLNNLGALLQAQGDYAAARAYYEQTLKIYMKVLGEEHPVTATALNNLGDLLRTQEDYATAQPYLEQALNIRRKVLGEHRDTAASLNNLGLMLKAQGDYAGARSYYAQAIQIWKKVLGEEHPDTARSLNNLGLLLQAQGDYASARPYYEQALMIHKKILGEEHPATATSLNNLVALEAALGHWDLAADLEDQARRGIRRHVARVLPALSEKEQLTFLRETDEVPFHGALTLGLVQRQDPKLSVLSAAWLLNGKGVVQAALAERALLTRDVQNPKLAVIVQELLEVRRKLAGVALAAPQPGKETARRETLEQLTAQEERLARQLSEAGGRTARTDPWVELADVRQALPAEGILIDVARFDLANFHAKGKDEKYQPAHYVAWIIPPAGAGDVQIVDLGEAKAIDERIEQVRQLIANAGAKESVLRQQGEREAVRQLQEQLTALSKQIWMPLAPHVGNAQTLLLSPDAALWLVPWGALPTGNEDEFLIEKFTFNYLISGRDVVSSARKSASSNPSTVFANPDFDLSPDSVLKRIKAVLRDLAPKEDDTTVRSLSQSGKTALPKVIPLPGTADEAQAITPLLKKLTGSDPQVYVTQDALESVVKTMRGPRVAVLSTHGFFLPDQEVKRDDRLLASSETRSVALTVDGKPLENPLLRCGLLLAGCNAPGAGQGTAGDDGVLTGLEIVGIDLRGTELVVLSACETGIGQVRNGEGVAGLRQAFQLAGAEAVVATLWQIPDVQSARLMNDFFTNLAAGQSKGEALRNAQLKQIKARREKFGAAHPYFWAAFTLTGK